MNASQQTLLLSTDGFSARPELTAHAEAKAAKLLRHVHPRVQLVRVHVKLEKPHSGGTFFAVRATAERAGSDFVIHAVATEPEAAISAVFDKLERTLSSTAGARKHRQHHPQAIELEANLPKAV